MAILSLDHLRHIVVLFLAVYSVSVLVFFSLDFWQHSRAELIPRFGAYFSFPYGYVATSCLWFFSFHFVFACLSVSVCAFVCCHAG